MAIAEAWNRHQRRRAWLIAVGTLLLTLASVPLFARATWRKFEARHWPTAPARVEGGHRVSDDPKSLMVEGRRVRVDFSYTLPDGSRHHARQEVSMSWADAHRMMADGSFNMIGRDIMARSDPSDRPWETDCSYDPAHPDTALLERTFAHPDVVATFPAVILLFGGLWSAAAFRSLRTSDDPAARLRARNESKWRIALSRDVVSATATQEVTSEAAILAAIVNFPLVRVDVAPHPLPPRQPVTIRIALPDRARRPRHLRVRLMCGPFNTSGAPRHARWSADLFDAALAPGVPVTLTARVPPRSDLPADCDDAWLWISARSRLGFRCSRSLWLALAEPRPVTFRSASV